MICKSKLLAKPLVKCLSLFDQSYTTRTLKIFDQIVGYNTQEDLMNFLEDVKDELIDKLYEILYEQKVVQEIKNKNTDFIEINRKI